jgi:hypothetical protein
MNLMFSRGFHVEIWSCLPWASFSPPRDSAGFIHSLEVAVTACMSLLICTDLSTLIWELEGHLTCQPKELG